jgi:hypothetical protein
MTKDVTILTKAIQQVSQSKVLATFFEAILAIGNFINSGTARGKAKAFKVPETLKKLYDTKSSNGKMTLLRFLCKEFKSHDIQQLKEEVPSLDLACKRNDDVIMTNIFYS